MHIILILLVIAGGMGLSVEAGLLGRWAQRWATCGRRSAYSAWERG